MPQQLVVYEERIAHDIVDRIEPFRALARGFTEPATQHRILSEPQHRIRECGAVARLDQQSRDAVAHHLAATRHVRRDHRPTDARRFEQRLRQPFAIRRQTNHMRSTEIRANVASMTEPFHHAFRMPRFQLRLGQRRRIALVHSTDQLKPPGRLQHTHAARRSHELANAFVAQHPRHQHERDRLRRLGRAREFVQVDPRTADQIASAARESPCSRRSSAGLPCSER